ncbi:MAG: DUF1028 domain-containing protein [Phycisphaerales bacterium]|nr:DUF1028 domain-containing protein [Phycisphaerales bacterium]
MNKLVRKIYGVSSKLSVLGAGVLAFTSSSAHATWSILIADTRTGEIVIASATCVETINLRNETPVLITGVGAVTAQSAVDSTGRNRLLIRDRLLQGVPLESILEELSITDTGHNNRQYGFITALGETLTYSGVQNANWAGGTTGSIEQGRPGPLDDIVYSVQGNILSGPNVVADAVDAIINTDSDLPGRLMAAMDAAQLGGGDGRCSCSNADPTGCGSPPPGPFKSAHVGYMLGTRADNIDAVRAAYPITNSSGGMTLIDINHDGKQDVVVADSINDELSVFINTANEGDPLSHVLPTQVVNLGASGAISVVSGLFDNDDLEDIAIVSTTPPTLTIMTGGGDFGVLNPPISLPLPAVPSGAASGDINVEHDIIAVSFESLDLVHLYRIDPFGAIVQESSLSVAKPGALLVAELNDAAPQLVVASLIDNQVKIYRNNGLFNFTLEDTIDTSNEPVQLKSFDLQSDGEKEIICMTQSGRRVEIISNTGAGWEVSNSITINRDGRGLAIGDLTNDGLPDIISTSSSPQRNLQVFANDSKGGFVFDDVVKVGSGSRFVELVDMNANGNLDLVVSNGGTTGLMLIDNPRGAELPAPGRYADGDYFLELNIANQRQADPDPVDQLRDQFNEWRKGLEGKVDAVQSLLISRNHFQTNSQSSVVIELRDWQGELLSISDPQQISLSQVDPNLFTVGPPVLLSAGKFSVTITSKDQLGSDQIAIRVGSGSETVRLMPDYEISVVDNISDINGDGRINYFDIVAFLYAFQNGDLDADFTLDGFLDFHDIATFISVFNR